ncbi:MAG: hypothetical protein LKI58_08430 [Actinomyces sp.]|jgi:hypothetical protein|nr:hypothetical protein [Actinomyces sp.]MCI1642137.1 hypothetical protein [Actinomyces sp.]MCI1662409.1 hypothetical protein [Actinomyces sp.]MCI1691235.1 hypothetical protein [Actinomyces sp.]MCI1788077.1 hypothetical protein [Actinomyces sp.]MCI1830470.1 hypothetical protein [Actinomyces sp.]
MLKTLLGEQFRSTSRVLAAVAGVVLLVASVSLVPAMAGMGGLGSLGLVLASVLVACLTPIVGVLLAWDYWQTMYGRRGYFTMTLPVRGRELFAAKALHALVATAVAAVVTLGGVAACLLARGRMAQMPLGDAWSAVTGTVGDAPAGALAGFGAILAIQLVVVVIQVAAVLSISAESRFQGLGWGAPLIGLVLLYLVDQVVNLVGMLWIPLGIRLSGPQAGNLVARGMWPDVVEALRTGADPTVIGLGSVATGAALTVALAWWAVRSIERRTSLR